jgi:hypothetical protein
MAHLTESKTIALLSVVFVLPLLVLACRDFGDRTGSSGLTPTTDLSAAGVWEGQYTTLIGEGDAGDVTLVIKQDSDGSLSGCSCWTQAACWDDGPFVGSVKNGRVQTATMLDIRRVTRLIGTIEIIGNTMEGGFEVALAEAANCSDLIQGDPGQGTLLGMQRVAADVDVEAICNEILDDDVNPCSDFVIPLD